MEPVTPALASGCTRIAPGESIKHTLAQVAQGKAGFFRQGKKPLVCLSDASGEAEVDMNSGTACKRAALRRQHASHAQDLIPPSSASNLGAPAGADGVMDGCTVTLATFC